MKTLIPLTIGIFGWGCLVGACSREVPPTAAQAAAEGAYGAALLRCVDDAKTLAESKACRARVNAQWQIVETVAKDGGK